MRWTALAIAVFVPAAVLTVQARAEPGDNPAAGLSGIGTYGRDIYQGRCFNCHSNKPGQSSLAPTLLGLIGRKAGGVHYSEKLKQLDFLWSRVSLRAWLSSQSLDSPILRMRHLGVDDPADLQALIEYLVALK